MKECTVNDAWDSAMMTFSVLVPILVLGAIFMLIAWFIAGRGK